jgi:chemotaxis protein methyltransferase WspC
VAPILAAARVPPDVALAKGLESGENLLARAMRLANEGRLDEAFRIGTQYLQQDGTTSAEAHFLMAMIHAERKQPGEAERHLRKALYLNPDHVDALDMLAVIEEQRGDRDKATLLRDRAERARNRADLSSIEEGK